MTIYNSDGESLLEAEDGIKSFENVNLVHPSFAGLELEGARFDGCNFVVADFRHADLYSAWFYNVNCPEASFQGASLRGATLHNCNLAGADFTNADFNFNNLHGTGEVSGCNLVHAVFTGADLAGVELTRSNVVGATYSHRTRFPEGFDPETAGMIRVEDQQPVSPPKALPY